MVRQVEIRACIGPGDANLVWQTAYAEADAMQRYHLLTSKDPQVNVSAWAGGAREVTFSLPLAAPDWVKNMIGTSVLRVRERQTVVWHHPGSFTVTSETRILNLAAASRFPTTLSLTVSERSLVAGDTRRSSPAKGTTTAQLDSIHVGATDASSAVTRGGASPAGSCASPAAVAGGGGSGGPWSPAPSPSGADGAALTSSSRDRPDPSSYCCDITFTVLVSAGVPWPANASIESIMAERAQAYLDFLQDLLNSKAPPDQLPAAPGRVKQPSAGGSGESPQGEPAAQGGRQGVGRLLRWPSITTSSIVSRPRPGGAARRGSQPGGSAGGGGQGEADLEEREEGGASGDFEDATEQWLSPASSFTTSGYVSETDMGGAFAGSSEGTAGGGSRRSRRLGSGLIPGGLQDIGASGAGTSLAALATAVQSIAQAVQSLDTRMSAITAHLGLTQSQVSIQGAQGALLTGSSGLPSATSISTRGGQVQGMGAPGGAGPRVQVSPEAGAQVALLGDANSWFWGPAYTEVRRQQLLAAQRQGLGHTSRGPPSGQSFEARLSEPLLQRGHDVEAGHSAGASLSAAPPVYHSPASALDAAASRRAARHGALLLCITTVLGVCVWWAARLLSPP